MGAHATPTEDQRQKEHGSRDARRRPGDRGDIGVPGDDLAFAGWLGLVSSGQRLAVRTTGLNSVRRRDSVFRRCLAVADIAAAYSALAFAVWLIGKSEARIRPAALLVAPFVVLLSKAAGLYDRDQHVLRKTTLEETPLIANVAMVYALGVWLAAPLVDGRLSRSQFFALVVAMFVFMVLSRMLARAAALLVTEPERCVVMGHPSDCARIEKKLASSPGVKAAVTAQAVDAENGKRPRGNVPKPAGPAPGALLRALSEHDAERVIIAPDSNDEEEILDAVRLVKAVGVKVSVLPRLFEVVGTSSTFDEVAGLTMLGLREFGLSRSSEFLKRSLDLLGAIGALVLLSPFLLLLTVLIKLDSPGPVLFRQPRVGRRGQRFEILKFRSMVTDAEEIKPRLRGQTEAGGGLFKITRDPRFTRVGGFLRHTSLDELPQLLNVVRGEMTLVGPRPLIPDEDVLIEGWHRRRLSLRPGMTGLWQIFGSARVPLDEMVKIDYLYGVNWSIWLDLKILLRTLPYIVSRRGL